MNSPSLITFAPKSVSVALTSALALFLTETVLSVNVALFNTNSPLFSIAPLLSATKFLSSVLLTVRVESLATIMPFAPSAAVIVLPSLSITKLDFWIVLSTSFVVTLNGSFSVTL